jgi:SAM-dependent methyltransferase
MAVLEQLHPGWAELEIHESSPSPRGASARIARDCARYTPSQYFLGVEPGSMHRGVRCENLAALTLPDESVDLVITQDVLEHIFEPARVFAEIGRVLKPGGSHIFTVPIMLHEQPSVPRARLVEGEVQYLLEPQYHGNPIDDSGALVTIDWGWDIVEHIFAASGLFTHVFQIDDLSQGIRAAHLEVYATMKPRRAGLTDLG